jgi:hypothetical protein
MATTPSTSARGSGKIRACTVACSDRAGDRRGSGPSR